MTDKTQNQFPFLNTSLNNPEIPQMDVQTANQLLNNVLEACNMEPNTIPIETFEFWGNYKKMTFNFGKTIIYIFLAILIAFPILLT